MMTYGVPYLGSKNKLAEDIVGLLPEGKRFVDLFAGGCAITHCALLSGKWQTIMNNDLYPLRGQTLFRNGASGEYNKEEYYRIVGHDEFFDCRFRDPHMIAVWGWNFTTTYVGHPFERFCAENGLTDLRQLTSVNGIKKHYLYPLRYLKRLQLLSGLDLSSVEFKQMDYRDYQYEEGDVVYCDPPYENTDNSYGGKFDTERFWEWVRTRDYPVYVSEYKAPDDFISIWERRRHSIQSRSGKNRIANPLEKIFVHNRWR